MKTLIVVVLAAFGLAAIVTSPSRADAPAKEAKDKQAKILRVGAVAYGPDCVTIFRSIRHYFAKNGLPMDWVLYSNYDALVKALHEGQVDIAWNSPLAHGRFTALEGDSQALVMRDADCDYRVHLLVRKDAGISNPTELAGKTLVMGSCDAAEATVLPNYFLKKDGVTLDKVKILSLHDEVDRTGCPCHSEHHVLKALSENRGQVGIISEELWSQLKKNQPDEAAKFDKIWTSPAFSHCCFTAKKDFDKEVGAHFTKLMLSMTLEDPLTGQVLRLEHCTKWVKGGQDGYGHLMKALRETEKVSAAR